MQDSWYEIIGSGKPLSQGELIFDCPLITWKGEKISHVNKLDPDILEAATEAVRADVIVMTQACDLANNKVENVILCPHLSIDEFKKSWEDDFKKKSQTPTPKAWKGVCDSICNGFIWNQSMLNSGDVGGKKIDKRVVFFHEVYTIPRIFLESLVKAPDKIRIQLKPPYREHLSQAFARFFMRVGLPAPIDKAW
ncbi:MAG: hypothetical protein KBG04_06270 [Bacteroidales bacterium]|nr:hypothetical protein [Bacteroidales bacterium]